MNFRRIRNQLIPSATKQNILALLNPPLRALSPLSRVRTRLAIMLEQHRIEHLDLGGWLPVEGYFTLHLSSVEPYGFPQVPVTTMIQYLDPITGLPQLKRRKLESPAVSLNFNIMGGVPLGDATLQGVNMSHFLEHFNLDTGRFLLQECRRILKVGGVVRVSCPDLRKYAQAYIEDDKSFFAKAGSQAFCNYQNLPTPGAIVAGKAYDNSNAHKWFYDADTTIAILREAGFSSVAEMGLHQSVLPRITDIEPEYRAIESFYVEATV